MNIFYKNNPQKPLCPNCRLFLDICICQAIKKINLSTHISLFIHVKEQARLTNTGRLLGLTLNNFSMITKGAPDRIISADQLIKDGYQNLILHPAASKVLNKNEHECDLPINLIIPDGTWRQSNKLLKSEPALLKIPRVKLFCSNESVYQLRKESNTHHLSTFEAAAKALGILEGKETELQLMQIFNLFVHNLLQRSGRAN